MNNTATAKAGAADTCKSSLTPFLLASIKLIARTSEGSVRDSISLLDKALISQSIDENKKIEEPDVRQMLGLADKSKIIYNGTQQDVKLRANKYK